MSETTTLSGFTATQVYGYRPRRQLRGGQGPSSTMRFSTTAHPADTSTPRPLYVPQLSEPAPPLGRVVTHPTLFITASATGIKYANSPRAHSLDVTVILGSLAPQTMKAIVDLCRTINKLPHLNAAVVAKRAAILAQREYIFLTPTAPSTPPVHPRYDQ